MSILDFAKGNQAFKKLDFKQNEQRYLELISKGQHPKALFIGCSDSRVLPESIVAADPGDLFIVRNIGNFVPPYKPDNDFHATAAAIEYAVSVLQVEHIIVCGHSHCGACAALYQDLEDKPELIHTKKWLQLGRRAKEVATVADGGSAATTEKVSILFQIENLLSYPEVQKRAQNKQLLIHGWYYRIESGTIDYYDNQSNRFVPLDKEFE
ncbi:MAG: carbonic anhydrase [Campylobacterota bacterium]